MANLPLLPRDKVIDLLCDDRAFEYSVENNDVHNMQIVLRAHGYNFSPDAAQHAISFGKIITETSLISED
jgi:hypothetical protein